MIYGKFVRRAFSFSVTVIALFLLFRIAKLIFPCLLPFIFAYLTASLAEKPITFLSDHFNIKRSFCSVLCLSVLLLIITGLIVSLCTVLYYQLASFGDTLPERISQYVKRVESIEQSISTLIANAPADYRDYLVKMFRSLTEKLSAIPAYFSEKLPKILSAVAEEAPKLFLFILTYIIATFSIGADRNRLKNVLYTMTPQKLRPYIRSIKKELHDAVSGFFKSQLLLIMITFFELCICFYFIRIHHPPLISAVIAVLDALPLLGTGTVLLPWAIFSLIGGEKMMCIYLLVIYLLTALSRRLLEPRVVSSTLGLDPLLSLLSIYGGFVLFGVAGMMLLPLFVLLFVRLYSANKNAST